MVTVKYVRIRYLNNAVQGGQLFDYCPKYQAKAEDTVLWGNKLSLYAYHWRPQFNFFKLNVVTLPK